MVGSPREMEGYALHVVAQLGGGAQTFARKCSFVAPQRIRGIVNFRGIFKCICKIFIFFSLSLDGFGIAKGLYLFAKDSSGHGTGGGGPSGP